MNHETLSALLIGRRVMGIIEDNMKIYLDESAKALDILQCNRHSSVLPYKWFGPDPEPRAPGNGCACAGCEIRKEVC